MSSINFKKEYLFVKITRILEDIVVQQMRAFYYLWAYNLLIICVIFRDFEKEFSNAGKQN
tara:strand:- start:161 stop:340 length:180 start_codon:yes stop_codon:yes gene_type:complete